MKSKYSNELANLIQDKIMNSKEYFNRHLIRFERDDITFMVELIDVQKGNSLKITMYFGGNSQSGEIYVDRNGKRVSASDLRDDLLSFLWSRCKDAKHIV